MAGSILFSIFQTKTNVFGIEINSGVCIFGLVDDNSALVQVVAWH